MHNYLHLYRMGPRTALLLLLQAWEGKKHRETTFPTQTLCQVCIQD